jgi:hypothetical protein
LDIRPAERDESSEKAPSTSLGIYYFGFGNNISHIPQMSRRKKGLEARVRKNAGRGKKCQREWNIKRRD